MTYGTKTLSDLSGDKIIDSRDLVSRFEELTSEREDLAQAVEDAKEAMAEAAEALQGEDEPEDAGDALENANAAADELPEAQDLTEAEDALREWDEENAEELAALEAINEEGESCSDWSHGETMIRDDYFTEYAEELVKDIGDMPREIPSYIEIDWEATAENLKADYTTITIDGTDYYIRCC